MRQTLSQLESTWRWVIKVLDVAEGQLQRGQNFDVQVCENHSFFPLFCMFSFLSLPSNSHVTFSPFNNSHRLYFSLLPSLFLHVKYFYPLNNFYIRTYVFFSLLPSVFPQRHVMSLRSDGPTPTTSSHTPSHDSYRSFIGSTPAEYMTYLLRAHAREDTDCLPVIDLYG